MKIQISISVAKLSKYAKNWIRTAVDSPGATWIPAPQFCAEFSFLVPKSPVTVYRGLLFSSEVDFIKFIERCKIATKNFNYVPRPGVTSSWSHSLGGAVGFATKRSAGSVNSATLDWLTDMKHGNAISGEFGIVLKAAMPPKNIIADMTLLESDVRTKTYAIADEVFVRDVKFPVEIVSVFTRKGGQFKGNINKFLARFAGVSSTNTLISKYLTEAKRDIARVLVEGSDEFLKHLDFSKLGNTLFSDSDARDAKFYYSYLKDFLNSKAEYIYPDKIRIPDMREGVKSGKYNFDKEFFVKFVQKHKLTEKNAMERCFSEPYDIYREKLSRQWQESIQTILPKGWYEKVQTSTVDRLFKKFGNTSESYKRLCTMLKIEKAL